MNTTNIAGGSTRPPGLLRRLAGLVGRLPGLAESSARAGLVVELGEAAGWPGWALAALALGEIDWPAVAAHLRRAFSWPWAAVAALTLPELLEVLEELAGRADGQPDVSPVGPEDGPHGRGHLVVGGARYGPFTRAMMLLLRAVWGKGEVPIVEAIRLVYGPAATRTRETALEQLRKRLNRRMREEACPAQVRMKAGHYAVEAGPSG